MNKEDLRYIKNTLQFALDNGNFTNNHIESFFNCAKNSISTINTQLDTFDIVNHFKDYKEAQGYLNRTGYFKCERGYVGEQMTIEIANSLYRQTHLKQ